MACLLRLLQLQPPMIPASESPLLPRAGSPSALSSPPLIAFFSMVRCSSPGASPPGALLPAPGGVARGPGKSTRLAAGAQQRARLAWFGSSCSPHSPRTSCQAEHGGMKSLQRSSRRPHGLLPCSCVPTLNNPPPAGAHTAKQLAISGCLLLSGRTLCLLCCSASATRASCGKSARVPAWSWGAGWLRTWRTC